VQSEAHAEERKLQGEANREERAIYFIETASKGVERAQAEVMKHATSDEYNRTAYLVEAAADLAKARVMAGHWAQVGVAIRDHGLEPLAAVEAVSKSALSEVLHTARFGGRTSSDAHNFIREAEQKGHAAWLIEASRVVPSIPSDRW